MGTNYYWREREPKTCGECGHVHGVERLHIGKSSAGWTFSFAAHETPPLRSWLDWRAFLGGGHGEIVDEYGRSVSVDDFVALVEAKQAAPHALKHAENCGHIDGSFLDDDGYSMSEGYFS